MDAIFRSEKRRVFLSEALEGTPTLLALDAEATHYLVRVLRLREGTIVDAADGSGRLFQGELQPYDGGWALTSLRLIYQEPARAPRILAASLIKPDRWEWLVEKAGELGADVIVPIDAERSVVRIEAKKRDDRVARWQKIADGAARQCERLTAVKVLAPMALNEALAYCADAQVLMMDEAVALRPWPALQTDRAIATFIGPEGGWDDDERHRLEAAGALRCGLGANLLRAETAAIAAMTLVRALDATLVRVD